MPSSSNRITGSRPIPTAKKDKAMGSQPQTESLQYPHPESGLLVMDQQALQSLDLNTEVKSCLLDQIFKQGPVYLNGNFSSSPYSLEPLVRSHPPQRSSAHPISARPFQQGIFSMKMEAEGSSRSKAHLRYHKNRSHSTCVSKNAQVSQAY